MHKFRPPEILELVGVVTCTGQSLSKWESRG